MTLPDILILAAGASTRMAPRDKLTEPVDGRPLLAVMASRALATGAPVTVVLPPDRPARAAALAGLAVTGITAENAAQGMSASLIAGIAALPRASVGVLILPADMAALTSADLVLMLSRFAEDPARLYRGTDARGAEGHPVIFPADLFPALRNISGDEGARAVLKANRHRLSLVPLPEDHATLDLDTPEDWARFRSRDQKGTALPP